MNNRIARWFRFHALAALLVVLLGNFNTHAASVGPAGYTNDFTVWPVAADWATVGVPGGGGDVYDLDTDVNTNLAYSVTGIGFQVVSNAAALPAQLTNATWSSSGGFVQTRPNGTRATVLLGKFVNNTGTNAAQIRIAYQLTLAGTAVNEDAGKGRLLQPERPVGKLAAAGRAEQRGEHRHGGPEHEPGGELGGRREPVPALGG